MRSFSCIQRDWPPHASRPSWKLLWYFWFYSQLISVILFKHSTNHPKTMFSRTQLYFILEFLGVQSLGLFCLCCTFNHFLKYYKTTTWITNCLLMILNSIDPVNQLTSSRLSYVFKTAYLTSWQKNFNLTKTRLKHCFPILQNFKTPLHLCPSARLLSPFFILSEISASTEKKIYPWKSISILLARQLSLNFAELALFYIIFQLTPLKLLLYDLYSLGLTIATLC